MFLNTLHTHQQQNDLVKPARWHRSLSVCCTIAYWAKLHIYKEGNPPIINNFSKKSRKRLQSPPYPQKNSRWANAHREFISVIVPRTQYFRISVLPYLRTSVLCTSVLPYFALCTSVLPYFRKQPWLFSSYHRCTWSQRCSRHRRPCRSADQPCYSRSRQPPRG